MLRIRRVADLNTTNPLVHIALGTKGDGLRVFHAANDSWKNRPHASRRVLLKGCRGKIVNVRPSTIKR